jgi:hypothetical protein
MSQISNIHAFVPFVAGSSKAANEQRLMKIGYKVTKNQKNPKKSVCASIPPVNADMWAEENVVLRIAPHINQFLEDVQDKIGRALYEAGKNEVRDEDISIEQVIAYLDSESNGNRLTKEVVEKWFTESLQDYLSTAVMEKMGITEYEDEKIVQMMNAYKGSFAALSGGATIYPIDKVNQLLRALEFTSSEDNSGVGEKLKNRLEGMMKPSKDEMLLNL